MRSEDGVAQSPPLDGTRPEPNAFANHVDLGNLPSSLHPSDRLRMARVIRPPRSILPRRHGQRSRQPLDISERHIESRGRTAPKMFYQRGVLAHLPVPFDLSAPAGTKSMLREGSSSPSSLGAVDTTPTSRISDTDRMHWRVEGPPATGRTGPSVGPSARKARGLWIGDSWHAEQPWVSRP
jgi:hypothetical protein